MVDPNGEFPWLALAIFAAGTGFDVGFQMAFEGKSLSEVNGWRALASGATGLVGMGTGALAGRAISGFGLTGARAFAVGAAGTAADFGVGLTVDHYLFGDSMGTALASNVIGFGIGEGLGYLGRGIGRSADVNVRAGDTPNTRTGAPCPANSFAEDTLVSIPDGYVEIADIQIGDTVYAYNEETGEVEEQDVLYVFIHDDDTIVTLTIDGEVIETTPWHPFYTDEGWVDAEDLQPGDLVLALDGDYGVVEATLTEARTQTMYDLDVAIVDTFAVGDGAWVVHNCDIPQYAIGNLGNSVAAREHNLETLKLYNPSTTTVFSGIHDVQTRRWIAYPSEGTVLNTGITPPIGFHVGREGGHRRVFLQWRDFDSTVYQGKGNGWNRNIGFTLFYFRDGELGIRWTSRSVNEPNWRVDTVLPVFVPQRDIDPVIQLWDPVLNGVEKTTGIMPVYLPESMMPSKPGRP